MSTVLSAVKKGGRASHKKERRSQLLSEFCIFLNNALNVSFGRNFRITLINSTQFCLKFVNNFVYTRVIGLVIKIEYCFQQYNKFRVAQNRVIQASVVAPTQSPFRKDGTGFGILLDSRF